MHTAETGPWPLSCKFYETACVGRSWELVSGSSISQILNFIKASAALPPLQRLTN